MQLEQNIQKRFIGHVTKAEGRISQAHKVYQELIYYRFEEVFEKAFPRFRKMVSEETFTKLIYDFLEVGAQTPILWQVSGEFRDFLSANNTLNMPYLQDLLTFEFLEIEMFMQKYEDVLPRVFDLQKSFQLSSTVKIVTFNYPIHNPEFDFNVEAFEKAEYRLLFFYDFDAMQVMCEEITPFLEEFLESLSGTLTVTDVVDSMSQKYEVASEEIIEIMQELLRKYIEKGVLV